MTHVRPSEPGTNAQWCRPVGLMHKWTQWLTVIGQVRYDMLALQMLYKRSSFFIHFIYYYSPNPISTFLAIVFSYALKIAFSLIICASYLGSPRKISVLGPEADRGGFSSVLLQIRWLEHLLRALVIVHKKRSSAGTNSLEVFLLSNKWDRWVKSGEALWVSKQWKIKYWLNISSVRFCRISEP